jgi:hypothetical protein
MVKKSLAQSRPKSLARSGCTSSANVPSSVNQKTITKLEIMIASLQSTNTELTTQVHQLTLTPKKDGAVYKGTLLIYACYHCYMYCHSVTG